MRKALFILLSAIVLCACRGPEGPMGPQGPAGEGVNWKIADLEVKQWDYSNFSDNNYYFAKFDVPALTSFVFTDGNVNGYIYLKENGETIQHSLPYVLHQYEVAEDGTTYFYTRTVDFVYGAGWVQIEVRDSDFAYEDNVNIVPDPMNFRIVMTY
ncbi:MAG: hypothetical protein J5688_01140 [Paludibacteraceae bacterium]|nr:hypothetical protein [Paludibacteraceae bacterium]